jgi:hypothetical protein
MHAGEDLTFRGGRHRCCRSLAPERGCPQMISWEEAKFLVASDVTVADLVASDSWFESATLYAVTATTKAKHVARSGPADDGQDGAVIFVNKATGEVQQSPYPEVSRMLKTMRPLERRPGRSGRERRS